jgi:hypothetical protein
MHKQHEFLIWNLSNAYNGLYTNHHVCVYRNTVDTRKGSLPLRHIQVAL